MILPIRFSAFLLLLLPVFALAAEPKHPNVLLIITDDQGYGDIGFHGNTMIQTPNLDALAKQSIRLTNFHVDPTCAETRAALMTGKYSCRVGVWHTIMGRSILRKDEKIMPQYFAEAGYATGMFGKWHLGDNWPYRPHDRGFQETLYCRGGGVGQSPDHWGNDYFNDTFMRNGKPEKQEGYCTDVWFREATKFIEKHKEKPFFCYVATNAPHGPYHVDEKYAQPYLDKGVPQPMANFYGMIANIDENIGRLLGKLDEWKLAENTIVVFMTDNGSAMGVLPARRAGGVSPLIPGENEKWLGFNAGMRAQKGSQYEGGHRVPCHIRWPADKQLRGSEVNRLTAHFDLLPTLLSLCQCSPEGESPFDGSSLIPFLHSYAHTDLWRRTLVVHSQRVEHPEKWRKSCVMDDNHRLIDGKELFFLPDDPGEQKDIAAKHPDAVKAFISSYDLWWNDVSKRFNEYSDIPLGDKHAPVQELCCHDWHPVDDKTPPWNQSGQEGVAKDPLVNGQWAVEVARPGKYAFTLRMRPSGLPYKIATGKARVKIGDVEGAVDISDPADSVTITLDLQPTGHVMLQTWLDEADGKSRGAYYTTVKRIDP
ncbi:MAG: arylsulfatase [Pirellulaceae bacterium]|nr:arylsulfatase [Pirellulaceae bacterium]